MRDTNSYRASSDGPPWTLPPSVDPGPRLITLKSTISRSRERANAIRQSLPSKSEFVSYNPDDVVQRADQRAELLRGLSEDMVARVNRAIDTMLAPKERKLQQQEDLLRRYSEKLDEVMQFWMDINAELNDEIEAMIEKERQFGVYALKVYTQMREVLLDLSPKRLAKLKERFPDLYALLKVEELLKGGIEMESEETQISDYTFKIYTQMREVLLNLSPRRLSKLKEKFPDLYALLKVEEFLKGDSDTESDAT